MSKETENRARIILQVAAAFLLRYIRISASFKNIKFGNAQFPLVPLVPPASFRRPALLNAPILTYLSPFTNCATVYQF